MLWGSVLREATILQEELILWHMEINVAYNKNNNMERFVTLTEDQLRRELTQAFIHGQGNAQMMEAGLERDETTDYVRNRLEQLLRINTENT